MKRINLTNKVDKAEADKMAGTLLGEDSYDILVTSDTEIYKPNGELLLKYVKKAIPISMLGQVYKYIRKAATQSHNRGTAAGKFVDGKSAKYRIKKDGTRTNTAEISKPVNSGIIGFFDRYPRIPYCRQTSYNINNPSKFKSMFPFFQTIDKNFAEQVPDRYKKQKEIVKKTLPEWIISDTVFSTVTVNKNWQTAVHKDAKDYEPGFGVMTALRQGLFDGCYLVFPEYRVAVDINNGGVLFADVHEWHGNTAFKSKGGFERISLVLYYREDMYKCDTMAGELARVKATAGRGELYS